MGKAILTKSGARELGYEKLAGKEVSFIGISTDEVTEIYYGNKRLGRVLSYGGEAPGLINLKFDDGTPID